MSPRTYTLIAAARASGPSPSPVRLAGAGSPASPPRSAPRVSSVGPIWGPGPRQMAENGGEALVPSYPSAYDRSPSLA